MTVTAPPWLPLDHPWSQVPNADRTLTATAFRQLHDGELMDKINACGWIIITRYSKPAAVLLHMNLYEEALSLMDAMSAEATAGIPEDILRRMHY